MPPPTPYSGQFGTQSDIRLQEGKQKRGLHSHPEDTSNPSQKKQLARSTYVLLQLAVVILLIIALVTLYHLLH